MEQETRKIECPNCGHVITDVEDFLYHKRDEELKKKYSIDLTREKKKYEEQYNSLEKEKTGLEDEKKELQEKINSGIKEGLRSEKQKLVKELKEKAEEEQAERIKSLNNELEEKSKRLKGFNKAKADVERLKREIEEQKEEIETDYEKKLTTKLDEEKRKIRKHEEEKMHMKLSESEMVNRKLKEEIQELQRRAEQGSMQSQGEVQELAIEEWLSYSFPLDTIEEIKKGARGADCLQIINTRTRQNCGSIYYESKRTKGFQAGWIEKFKNDIRDKGADVGILVTESMPNDMDRMGLKDGVWICTFEEFKSLCVVMRDSMIRICDAAATGENKGDKMGMLYDFLTGNEFRLQIEAIVEGFTQLQSDLESEKRSMQSIWKKREKQIEKVLLNTNFMYSSIKGIAGNAIQSVSLLELPAGDEHDSTHIS